MAARAFRFASFLWLSLLGEKLEVSHAFNLDQLSLKRPNLTPRGVAKEGRQVAPQLDHPVVENQDVTSTARRGFFGASLLFVGLNAKQVFAAVTANEDLTASLYNPDGSLRADVASEAVFRTVSFRLSTTGESVEAIDGKPRRAVSNSDPQVLVSYELPDKWTNGYTENGNPVCRKISVYKLDQGNPVLSKATKIGVTKALETTRIGLEQADLMSGGSRDGYYDFDLAVAPKTCESSNDNLGLGFCPYDDIYLLSATTVGDQVYVFSIEATKDEWKRSNADIRRVRRSFRIEEVV